MSAPPPGLHEFTAEVRLIAAEDPEHLLGEALAGLVGKSLERNPGIVAADVSIIGDEGMTLRLHLLHEDTYGAAVLTSLAVRGILTRLTEGIEFEQIQSEVKRYGT